MINVTLLNPYINDVIFDNIPTLYSETTLGCFHQTFLSALLQKVQKERQEKQEKQEKEEGEKKEKQRQEAEEVIRKMHEGTDPSEERVTAAADSKEAKASGDDPVAPAQVPETVGDTVEVDADVTSTGTNTDKTTAKTNNSALSEEADEETLEGEEKIGKDGE